MVSMARLMLYFRRGRNHSGIGISSSALCGFPGPSSGPSCVGVGVSPSATMRFHRTPSAIAGRDNHRGVILASPDTGDVRGDRAAGLATRLGGRRLDAGVCRGLAPFAVGARVRRGLGPG